MHPSVPSMYGFANFNSLSAIKSSNKCANAWCFLNVLCVCVCVVFYHEHLGLSVVTLDCTRVKFLCICVMSDSLGAPGRGDGFWGMRAALRAHISAMCEVAGKVKAGNLLHNHIRVNECSRLVIGWSGTPQDGTSPGTEDYRHLLLPTACALLKNKTTAKRSQAPPSQQLLTIVETVFYLVVQLQARITLSEWNEAF